MSLAHARRYRCSRQTRGSMCGIKRPLKFEHLQANPFPEVMMRLAPQSKRCRRALALMPALLLSLMVFAPVAVLASPQAGGAGGSQSPAHHGGEINLLLPDLNQVEMMGIGSRTLLLGGLGVCVLGMLFGLLIYSQLKNMPVHESMREISELIYETCKTYLLKQGKFLLVLELFIGAVIVLYFSMLPDVSAFQIA